MSELAKALCAAQAKIDGAKKDSANPHFKSKYADLSSVWDACKSALTSNGLSVAQFGRMGEHGPSLVTRLLHVSGESIEGEIPLLNGKGDMQGLGSAITYARRYGLAAIVGVSPEDDDGNTAVSAGTTTAKTAPVAAPTAPDGYDDWRADFVATADTGIAAMTEAWAGSSLVYRTHWATEPRAVRDALRARAQAVVARA